MVKVADIYKDFQAFSKATNDNVWAYRDIFDTNGKNEFGYNYQKIIDEASQKIGHDVTQELVENGILHPMALGEYEVDCGGAVKNGGGISTEYGIFVSDGTDLATVYHELAHAFQKKLNVFKQYPLFENHKEIQEKLAKENSSTKLVDFFDYNRYINEVHAEVFAYCAMMLRAENSLDFNKQATLAYLRSNSATFAPLIDENTSRRDVNPLFYYASLPAMKESIKQMRQIRKSGHVQDYFDENGCIRGDKLAEFAARIVYDKAYSPQAFSALTQKKLFVKPSKHEHILFQDVAKAYFVTGVAVVHDLLSKRKLYHQAVYLQKYRDTANIQKLQNIQKNFAKYQLPENDNEAKILNDVAKIYLDINTFAKKNGIDYSDISMIDFQLMKDNDFQFSPAYTNYIAQQMVGFYSKRKPKQILADLNPLLRDICSTMKSYKDNPKFFNTLYAGYAVCSQKFAEKKEFPQKKVLDDIKEPLFTSPQELSPLAVIISNIHSFEHLTQSFKANEHLTHLLSKVYLQDPQKLEDKKFQKKIVNAYIKQKGLKTRLFGDKKFETELRETIDRALYDDYKANSPKLKMAKRIFKDISPEKISEQANLFFHSSEAWEKALAHVATTQSNLQQSSLASSDTSRSGEKVQEALKRINLNKKEHETISHKNTPQNATTHTTTASSVLSIPTLAQINKHQNGASK